MSKLARRSALLMLVSAITLFTGCIDFSGKLRRDRENLLKKRDDLITEVKKTAHLFDERDRRRQELSNLQAQHEQLKHIKKMMEAEKK